MEFSMPVLAGGASTVMFMLGALPMLYKAYRTKDLVSYNLSNILLINAGNVVHSVYIFHLPPGPIWLLHAFHMLGAGLMLGWYLRYEVLSSSSRRTTPPKPTEGHRIKPSIWRGFDTRGPHGLSHTQVLRRSERPEMASIPTQQ